MNCFRCGLENEQGTVFCIHCGATLIAPPQAARPKKKRTGLIVGLAAGAVALAGILVAAYFLFLSGPGIKGLWVCRQRGWALRIEDSVLTEYSPAGTDKISYTYQNGQGTAILSSGEVSFTVSRGEMTLVDEETGEKYLFTRQGDDADVEALITAGLRGLWSSEELGRVIELDRKGTLKLHSAAGESDGSFTFDLRNGRGAIALDGLEYGFTAGWDIITVEGMGDFVRADATLDVAAFVMQYGKSPLAGTWYDVSGQYGAITFGEDGTYRVELYGRTSTGTYIFDIATGEGFIRPDDRDEPVYFILEDDRLALGEAAYTRQYVEQPGKEDYYAAIAGSWVAVKNHSLVLEFAADGTVVFYSGSDSASGTYAFNPVERTGTISLAETEHYPFRLTEDTLYVDDYPYVRADAVDTPERDPDSLLGIWYDEAGQAGTLYFDENGVVAMETHGVVYDGTYTFNKAAGSGTMVVQVDGEDVKISLYLLYGKLYTDDAVYTQTYVEQAQ